MLTSATHLPLRHRLDRIVLRQLERVAARPLVLPSHIHGRWLLQPSLGRVAIRRARIICLK